MMKESATVVSVDGEFALLETERRSTCGSCSLNSGCGTGVLARVLGRRRTVFRALNTAGAGAGDRVTVGLEEAALLQGSLAVYLVPLLAMLGAAVLGEAFGVRLGLEDSEMRNAGFGIFGLFCGLIWLRRYGRRIGSDRRYQPVVLEVREGAGAVRQEPVHPPA